MKKFLILAAILALFFAGCDEDSNNGNNQTMLKINNTSDYDLLSVEYSGVNFGDIESGKEIIKEVSSGTMPVFFFLQTTNGRIRCRTDMITCIENETKPFYIYNNTMITTVVTERQRTLSALMNILNNETPNPNIRVLYNDYPLASGGTIALGDIGKGQQNNVTLKITNEGEHDLVITGTRPQISGNNSAQAVAGTYSMQRISYLETAQVNIEFNPTETGSNSFVVTISNNDQTNGTYTINVTANVKNTWQRLHGQAGRRYGIYTAISNGQGGIYAGGFSSNNTAALFNINQYGNLLNTFEYNTYNGTSGYVSMGSAYNDYYSVVRGQLTNEYFITKTTSPAIQPTYIGTGDMFSDSNQQYLHMTPTGILRNITGYYFVAGSASLENVNTNVITEGRVFVHRHLDNGSFEKGVSISLNISGISADSYRVRGMALLTNGDVLLYGLAKRSGRDVAFAAAINVSNTNVGSWTQRWAATYEVSGKNNFVWGHFWDGSDIILLGGSDDGGFITKIPGNTTNGASVSGWPKTIPGIYYAVFCSGLTFSDNSGYLFAGAVGYSGGSGPHGGEDAWVVKTDKNGNLLWEKFFGGTGDDWVQSAVEVSDGFILGGASRSPSIAGQTRTGIEDIYILKINKDGTMD